MRTVLVNEPASIVSQDVSSGISVILSGGSNALRVEDPIIQIVSDSPAVNIAGNGPQNNITTTLTAGETIGYPRVLVSSSTGVVLFDPLTATQGSMIGLSNHSAVIGSPISIMISGKYTYLGWGLTEGAEYYAGIGGVLTTNPVTVGILQSVGVAIDSNTLILRDRYSISLI